MHIKTAEGDRNVASQGVGGTALGLAIPGTLGYNIYDLNFMAQYYLADFKSQGKEPVTFINMALDKFNDIDDPKAHESAYWTAKMRICRYK